MSKVSADAKSVVVTFHDGCLEYPVEQTFKGKKAHIYMKNLGVYFITQAISRCSSMHTVMRSHVRSAAGNVSPPAPIAAAARRVCSTSHAPSGSSKSARVSGACGALARRAGAARWRGAGGGGRVEARPHQVASPSRRASAPTRCAGRHKHQRQFIARPA